MQFSYFALPLSFLALAVALPAPSIDEVTGKLTGELTGGVDHLVESAEKFRLTGLDKITNQLAQGKVATWAVRKNDFLEGRTPFANTGKDCARAAAPQIVTCSKAFLTKSDIWDDAACAAGVIALGTNTPAQCSPCLDQLKNKIPFS
ncbi:hypothetical protein B0J12DRAFT_764946 [Macrophomina phaseolina]|uniref:Uncharacterized protein n=1 Tax=Macrophomina phaseolina TaxID=35725 RepID=A0ABQ8FZE6_9PEZI|nr:hypothetical protein B0J12DRAFT_764946 [Macrophomina phaseolina]